MRGARRERAVSRVQLPVVAVVSDAIYPHFYGGKELRYHELARRLVGRAVVHVYTMHWWDGPRVRTDGGVTYHAISRLRPMYHGDRRSFREAIFFAIGCLRLVRHHFDVLDADHMPYFQIFVLRLVTWLRRKRLVVTWHEVWGRSYWCEYLGWAGYAAWLVEWTAMRLPDHIIAASPQTAARLRALLGRRASITPAPNGIDFDAIRNAYPDGARTDLVAVGRLIEHKRIAMLLEAVALLHAEGIQVTCRIVGDGPQRAALHERARALGIAHAVDFRHAVHEQKEVYALVKAAKVAVFPSAREGFGIAALEAIACAVPVVTTSAPDNLAQYIVARSANGVVCEPSASAIAAAVKGALAGSGARSHDGDGQDQAWLAEYSWDTVTDQVARVLRV
jgi:glycosyltransferase involved in cell wall biosynthesis